MNQNLARLSRRNLLAAAAATLAGARAFAESDRPIRFILSHPPGGSADVIARLMQPKLEKLLGQPLIIENRAGAGGVIAMDALSKSKPDGYTIGLGASGALATAVALGDPVSYDPVKNFTPIAAVSGQPFILASPDSFSGKTVGDVIAMESLVDMLEELRPDAKGLITVAGNPVPVAYRMSDAALISTVGQVPRTPLREAVRLTIEKFEALG